MTKILPTLILVAALAAAVVTLAAANQTPEQKLQEAIDLIESKGDVPGAMPLLEDVAKSPNRALAARALLYLAQAQERVGQAAQARRTYERMVREFSEQTEIVAQARRRLAAMTGPANAASIAQYLILSGPAAARPWHSASPDGRYLSLQDTETGNLATWDVRTQTTRLVTRSKGWEEGSAYSSSWSPDSRQLTYSWLGADNATSLRVIPASGGTARTLYESKAVEWLTPFGWSADSRSILLELAGKDGTHQLALVSVGDRSIRIIKAFAGQLGPTNAAFSPDGRHIVYDIPGSFTDPQRNLFVMALDGSRERALVVGDGDDFLLGWLPDSRHVLFASDRRGALGAWAIAADDAKPEGQPILIKDGIGPAVSGLGFSRDGRFYYSSSINGSDVHTVALDPTTGKPTDVPRPLPRLVAGVTRGQATWSPDSTRIAYSQAFPGHGAILAVQTVGSAATRLYPLPVQGIERPFWQPDGRAVIIEAVDADRRQGLFRVDLETGAFDTFVQSPGLTSAFAAFAPDGSLIYARYNRSESTLRRRSPSTGAEDVLPFGSSGGRGVGANVLSPDGRLIAVWSGGTASASIAVGATSGGEWRPLVEDLRNSDNEITWSHDGKYVLFTKLARLKDSDPWSGEVWRVSVDGGAVEPLGIHSGLIKHLSIRPDGTALAVSFIGAGTRELLAWENIPGFLKNIPSR